MANLSLYILPLMIIGILISGIIKKVPVYEEFVEGAKDGFKVSVTIIPYLVAIIVGILFPLVGFICGGIGLSKSKKLNAAAFEEQKSQINKNRKLCLAGIIVSAVSTVISVIISVIIGAAFGKMVDEEITKNIDNGTYSYSYNSDEIPDNVEDYLNQYGIEIEN